jgi:hypothetical protein
MAQTAPRTPVDAQQITTICTWFIWQWETFRISVTTLQRPKEDGVWGFPNIGAKCRTLLCNRIQMLGEREGSVLSEQMRKCYLTGTLANPPNVTRIPPKIVHIQQYAMGMAYVPAYAAAETRKAFKNVCMTSLCTWKQLSTAPCSTDSANIPRDPMVAHMENLHASTVPDTVISAWFAAIHDILPINERLAAIHLTESSSCSRCGEPDSI